MNARKKSKWPKWTDTQNSANKGKSHENFLLKFDSVVIEYKICINADFYPGHKFMWLARVYVVDKFRQQKIGKFPKQFLICASKIRSHFCATTVTIKQTLYRKEYLDKQLIQLDNTKNQ